MSRHLPFILARTPGTALLLCAVLVVGCDGGASNTASGGGDVGSVSAGGIPKESGGSSDGTGDTSGGGTDTSGSGTDSSGGTGGTGDTGGDDEAGGTGDTGGASGTGSTGVLFDGHTAVAADSSFNADAYLCVESCSGAAPGAPALPEVGAGIDEAVSNALVFMSSLAETNVRGDVLVLLAALQRQYGFELEFDPLAKLDGVIADYSAGDVYQQQEAELYRNYRRLADPAQMPTVDFSLLWGIDAITLPALYCREAPLLAGYRDQVMSMAGYGGYAATHAMLALVLARDLGCDTGLDAVDVDAVALANAQVLDLNGSLSDRDIEVMLFMALTGDGQLIRTEWVDLLLRAQMGNGGWRWETPLDGSVSADPAEDHPSLLALWLLLYLQHAGAVDGPLVPRD